MSQPSSEPAWSGGCQVACWFSLWLCVLILREASELGKLRCHKACCCYQEVIIFLEEKFPSCFFLGASVLLCLGLIPGSSSEMKARSLSPWTDREFPPLTVVKPFGSFPEFWKNQLLHFFLASVLVGFMEERIFRSLYSTILTFVLSYIFFFFFFVISEA